MKTFKAITIKNKYQIRDDFVMHISANAVDTSHLEKEIDQLVYKLYDLTEEEIKIVEGK